MRALGKRAQGMRALVALGTVCALAACAPAAGPIPSVNMDPLRVPPPDTGPLAAVAFLSGCWRTPADAPGAHLEERWSPPEGGIMLSTSRFVSGDRVLSFEFGLIRAAGETVVYLPHPGGVASEHPFVLTAAAPGQVMFEAPEHDYPKRIRYTRSPEGLEARIDGGADDPEPRAWRMESIACR